MLHWLQYPFVRFTPAFAAGIILYDTLGYPDYHWIISVFLLVVTVLLFLILKGRRFFSLNSFAGGITLLILAGVGFLSAIRHHQLKSPDHFSRQSFSYYQGVVNSWPEDRGAYVRFTLKMDQVKDSNWVSASGEILMYIEKSKYQAISYGTMLIVRGSPSLVNGPRNPYEFDYRQYLARKNIFHQHFLEEDEFIITGLNYPNALKALAGKARDKSDQILKENIESEDLLGLARAMILGIRSGMDEEMKLAYSHAGAMHILAISGLHVGILFGFMALLLAPLRQNQRGKFVFTVIILTLLWSYAMLVGMSPSVMRATIMFSLIAVGQAFYRTANIFNTIAFSAMLLLIIEPFQLFEVGFQLSYLAVTGIVLLFRNIDSWVSSKYWLINKIWSITSVAIAAQLVTFPLALYYFHNFPNLFFLSNLIVIPSAFLILTSGICLLLSSVISISFLIDSFSFILSNTLEFMNKGVIAIEGIPYSSVSGVFLPEVVTLILYFVIIGIIAVVLSKRVQWVYFLGIAWIGLILTVSLFEIRRQQNRFLMIYDLSGSTVIDVVEDGRIESIESVIPGRDIGYQVDNFRIAMTGSSITESVSGRQEPKSKIHLYSPSGKSLAWISEELNGSFETDQRTAIDFVVISNSSVQDLDYLLMIFDPQIIVLDSSNDYFYSSDATQYLEDRGYKVYNTRQSGGVLLDLNSGNLNIKV